MCTSISRKYTELLIIGIVFKCYDAKVLYFKRSSSWVNVSDFYAFRSKTQSTKSSASKSTLISLQMKGM